MSDLPQSFIDILKAWNEKDPSKVRAHVEAALSPDVVFADPNYYTEGIDAFEAMVREFHASYPVSTCEHISGYDSHNNRYRYRWRVSINGAAALDGMDVTEIDANGLIVRVDGFFGDIPQST